MDEKPLIVLVQACKHSLITDKYVERYPYPPVGLIYISNMLTINGCRVEIIDLYLVPLSKTKFMDKLKSLGKPILIGISSYTDSIQEAYKVALAAKEVYRDTPIIFGGPHVSFMYKEVMTECPIIDYCCIGEGEALMVELLEHLQTGFPELPSIHNLVYRSKDAIRVNPKRGYISNLDILPLPYYSDLLRSGMKQQEGLVFVSSRGCPGGCIFCASRALSGAKYRFHSAEWIISMIYYYQEKMTLQIFGSLDDSFTVNRHRLRKFVAYLKQLNIRKPWSCKSRVDVIDEEMVELLSSSHCKSVHVGVESGDDEVLRTIEKHITLSKVFEAIKLLASNGLRAECSFILGHPADTLETMEKTLILASRLDQSGAVLSVAGICTPFPGTKIWNRIEQYRLKIHSYNWRVYDLSTPIFTTDQFTQDDLRRAYFYFNYLFKTGQELPQLTDCKHKEFIKTVDELVDTIRPRLKEEGA